MPKLQLRITKKNEKIISSSYFITIPKELVNSMKWKDGDILLFSKLDEKRLVLEND